MPKLTLKIHERLRALDLLKEGHTIESAVTHLHENYHSNRERDEVKRAYFPKSGPLYIGHLVGASAEDIDAGAQKLKNTVKDLAQRGSKIMTSLNADPQFVVDDVARKSSRMKKQWTNEDFKKASIAAATARIIALNEDPLNAPKKSATSSKTMTRLNQDEEFQRVRREGFETFIKKLRAQRAINNMPGGVVDGRLVPLSEGNFEDELHQRRLARALKLALSRLSDEEKHVVVSHFDLPIPIAGTIKESDKMVVLNSALAKLSNLKFLRKYLE